MKLKLVVEGFPAFASLRKLRDKFCSLLPDFGTMRVLRESQQKTNVPSLTTARTIEQIQSLDIYDRGVNRCSRDCSVFFFPVLPGEKGGGTFSGCIGCRQYESGLSAMETFGEL